MPECVTIGHKTHLTNSLVQYLYPRSPVVAENIILFKRWRLIKTKIASREGNFIEVEIERDQGLQNFVRVGSCGHRCELSNYM